MIRADRVRRTKMNDKEILDESSRVLFLVSYISKLTFDVMEFMFLKKRKETKNCLVQILL